MPWLSCRTRGHGANPGHWGRLESCSGLLRPLKAVKKSWKSRQRDPFSISSRFSSKIFALLSTEKSLYAMLFPQQKPLLIFVPIAWPALGNIFFVKASGGSPPITPPEVEVNRRRKDPGGRCVGRWWKMGKSGSSSKTRLYLCFGDKAKD